MSVVFYVLGILSALSLGLLPERIHLEILRQSYTRAELHGCGELIRR